MTLRQVIKRAKAQAFSSQTPQVVYQASGKTPMFRSTRKEYAVLAVEPTLERSSELKGFVSAEGQFHGAYK